ncbi:MAG: hypothetical protein JST15_02330 [Bacteroidetes bacterium]|nr:hypothetical protein [Bacteroidota bacterium]
MSKKLLKANHNAAALEMTPQSVVVNIVKETFESKSQRNGETKTFTIVVVNIVKETFESKSQLLRQL